MQSSPINNNKLIKIMGRELLSTMPTQERDFKCPLHQDDKAKCETHTYLEEKGR